MTIINDILDVSKMEAGKMHFDAIPFYLEQTLDNVYATMSELCRRKGVELFCSSNLKERRVVIGDPQRLNQVLINLVGNAIKFTHQGEVRIELTELSYQESRRCFQFSISDTGIGMSAEKQAKLFQAFSQGDNSVTRNYGGTGLGLHICKQLVTAMGGTIRVVSKEKVGSIFTFTIFLVDAEPDKSVVTASPVVLNPSQLQILLGARILLVEDNEVNRLVAVELLQQIGVDVDVADNGSLALEMLRQSLYHCVLLDVQMPDMDGYQVARELRKISGCEKLPVIAMTANVMPDNYQKCLEAGMDDFLSKPILSERLYNIVLKWVSANKATP